MIPPDALYAVSEKQARHVILANGNSSKYSNNSTHNQSYSHDAVFNDSKVRKQQQQQKKTGKAEESFV